MGSLVAYREKKYGWKGEGRKEGTEGGREGRRKPIRNILSEMSRPDPPYFLMLPRGLDRGVGEEFLNG